MKERVVSLTDRGRGLEWLSLGFGLWLVASMVFALVALDMTSRVLPDGSVEPTSTLALACTAIYLAAIATVARGLALLSRTGPRLCFGISLAALVFVLADRTALVWLPLIDFGDRVWEWQVIWGIGSIAQVVLVTAAFQGIRELANREGDRIPIAVLAVATAAEITRALLVGYLPLDEHLLRLDPLLPWARAALVGVTSLLSVGLLLAAIRAASRVVRPQIWAGEPGVTSPARAIDWQRTAAGLDRTGAFLIGKIAIGAAAMPVALIGLLTDTGDLLSSFLVPFASALCSAGMVAGLLACRRLPDPPDARAGFTGAALLVAACLVADVYLLAARAGEPLADAISSLGHLVAYIALLRSVGRIGERLGDDDVTRRARVLGWLAIGAVGGATVAGYLLVDRIDDLGIAIAAPIVVAGFAFAALLPCAILTRQLARRLRERFTEPPRAVARVHSRDDMGDTVAG